MAGHMYNGRETELLIPASSLEVLKIAVIFGARSEVQMPYISVVKHLD